MKKTIVIILVAFTISLFPTFAQDEETDTPVTETEIVIEPSTTDLSLDITVSTVLPKLTIQAYASAFCGHSC